VLAQLVSTRQVVLLCNSIDAHFFYRGKVYHRLATSGFKDLPERVNPPESSDLPERSDSDLPKRSNRRYFPIWTLVDVDNKPHGLNIPKKSNIWPVQASSPIPVRWKAWSTHYGAAVLGMPLWDMKELMEGCVFGLFPFLPSIPAMAFHRGSSLTVLHLFCSFRLRPDYDDFKTKLQGFLPLPVGPTPPTSDDRTIDAALKVLHTEAVRQQTLVTQADSAIEILIQNATEEFGFAPHDAYGGIVDFPTTKGTHATTLEILDCSKLKTFVNGFSERETFHQFSHRVVTVWPRQTSGKHDDWEIGFKSSRIEKGVMERMLLEEDKYLWETLEFFYKIRVGASFAGCIFEALVHRLLSHCWLSDPVRTPQPIRMKSNDHNPPTFSTPDTLQSSPELQPIRTVSNNGEPPTSRAITLVKSPDLSNVTLDKDKYYIPSAPNCALFDSFIIDHDRGQQTTAISVFEVTMSSTHGGSHDGYGDIRKIMARVCDLLENPNAQVKVVYFLVCPEDGLTYRWQMPTGWAGDAVVHNHPGEVFCIRIPSSKRSGTSCLFTPSFATQLNRD
jgi:hypothetical protein